MTPAPDTIESDCREPAPRFRRSPNVNLALIACLIGSAIHDRSIMTPVLDVRYWPATVLYHALHGVAGAHQNFGHDDAIAGRTKCLSWGNWAERKLLC